MLRGSGVVREPASHVAVRLKSRATARPSFPEWHFLRPTSSRSRLAGNAPLPCFFLILQEAIQTKKTKDIRSCTSFTG